MTLERWLEIATHGLAPSAASRVRREYTNAFHDAHDAGERDVLAGWGDPHRVGRELRRVHLTTREARALHPGYVPTWGGLRRALGEDLGFIVSLLGIVLWHTWQGDPLDSARLGAVVGILLLLPLLRWVLVSRLSRWPRWRTAALWTLQVKTGLLAAWLWSLWALRDVWSSFRLPAALNWEVAVPLLCFALCLGHLWTLPTALRAAAKQEGEAA